MSVPHAAQPFLLESVSTIIYKSPTLNDHGNKPAYPSYFTLVYVECASFLKSLHPLTIVNSVKFSNNSL